MEVGENLWDHGRNMKIICKIVMFEELKHKRLINIGIIMLIVVILKTLFNGERFPVACLYNGRRKLLCIILE
jgi:hypothetical protein